MSHTCSRKNGHHSDIDLRIKVIAVAQHQQYAASSIFLPLDRARWAPLDCAAFLCFQPTVMSSKTKQQPVADAVDDKSPVIPAAVSAVLHYSLPLTPVEPR